MRIIKNILILGAVVVSVFSYNHFYGNPLGGVQIVQKRALTSDGSNIVGVDADGHLQVSDEHNGLSIAQGEVSGTTYIHKFGYAEDFDTGDGAVNIWGGADDAGIDQMEYVFSTTTNITEVVSDSASDTFDLEVQGLDVDWALSTQTVTLNGQTPVSLTTDLRRVFRMKNVNSADNVGHIYATATTTSYTAGVPDNTTKVRAVIHPNNNQTLMAIYTIPAGKTGYMSNFWATTAGANKTSNYVIDLKARPFGKVFNLKNREALSDVGTSHINQPYYIPEVFAEKTDIMMTADVVASGVTGAAISAGFDIILIDN